ncbi:carboxyl transferase domain-containing protein [Arthrobacter crystallopoietes]|uniref:Acetyl-CoA carboxylase carboxyl transferase subunit beta n=1 Tax=Crystallibacter crystallopoietes TaxID=37928 RepID=A0A1H1ADY7_9MICC|nr:carboxyl transferase domain-containing protein [Arthrobacter crystallopoietes]AUI51565.1 acetyl-CoA carboxyl transferase [Arthrobacter crystallopoietes]SDQ37918.1 acetyl-CoA carboxylase carboxyl transferase subunit beta [Arthrobacter crystallopoietes]
METLQKTRHLNAVELIDTVLDPGSFNSWDTPPAQPAADEKYRRDLDAAARKSGTDESVLTGEGFIRGRRVAVIVSEFAFLAGSIGQAAAERITAAVERATAERLPLLAGPASGGTRMQEGTLAFLAMVKITAAVHRHRQEGLPYLVYLRHPTTGGVMASWGSLGHVTVAEPGALLGFLGPRVFEALNGEPFPEGVQVSENLFHKGLIDAVAPPQELPEILDRALNILLPGPAEPAPAPETVQTRPADADGWASIQISRNTRRPDLRWLLAAGAADALPLNGTGQGENDPGLQLALARFGRQSCVVLGHERPRDPDTPAMGPGSLREARRGMKLAEELGLPLLTVIDTAGAALSKEAEEGGLAGEIARSLQDLVGLQSPSVSVLLGQGAGGGALALLPADRIIAAQHAWLSPLPPEGASAILHRTTEFAPSIAMQQGVNVTSLYGNGLVDHIVDERPDAAVEPKDFCRRMAQAIEYELSAAASTPAAERVARRWAKFRQLGR